MSVLTVLRLTCPKALTHQTSPGNTNCKSITYGRTEATAHLRAEGRFKWRKWEIRTKYVEKNPNHTQIFTVQYEQEVLHKHITFQRLFSVVGQKISLEKCARSKQKFSFSILWLFFCNVILQSK